MTTEIEVGFRHEADRPEIGVLRAVGGGGRVLLEADALYPAGTALQLSFRVPDDGTLVKLDCVVERSDPPPSQHPDRAGSILCELSQEACRSLGPFLHREADRLARLSSERADTRRKIEAASRLLHAHSEQRQHPRGRPEARALFWTAGPWPHLGTIHELSVGGFWLETDAPAVVGTKLRILFRLPGTKLLKPEARIVHTEARGLGARFGGLTRNEEQRIARWVEQDLAERRPAPIDLLVDVLSGPVSTAKSDDEH